MATQKGRQSAPADCIVSVLLDRVEQCFRDVPDGAAFKYSLGKIAGRWRFTVTDSWQRWMDHRLQHQFDGRTAAEALLAFLQYVQDHKIDCAELSESAR